jgi:prevent-host-death family protein
MIATKTALELNREPSKVLRQAEQETVIIEKHGVPRVVMMPYRVAGITGTELAKRLRRLKPAPEAAKELKAILKGVDDAGRRSYPH